MRAIVVVLAFWCAVHNGVLAGTLSEADSALKALKIKLVHGTIARIDIFFMPYDMLTVARVTPEVLEMDAQKKMSVELSSDLAETLVRAIDNTKIYQTQHEPDLRWGAVFFDKSGKRVHSIYLNSWYLFRGAGRIGYVDDVRVGLNHSLISWFERQFDRK